MLPRRAGVGGRAEGELRSRVWGLGSGEDVEEAIGKARGQDEFNGPGGEEIAILDDVDVIGFVAADSGGFGAIDSVGGKFCAGEIEAGETG